MFREVSSGGHFKGRDPTVAVATLQAVWVPGAPAVYVGKAEALRRRPSERGADAVGDAVAPRRGLTAGEKGFRTSSQDSVPL